MAQSAQMTQLAQKTRRKWHNWHSYVRKYAIEMAQSAQMTQKELKGRNDGRLLQIIATSLLEQLEQLHHRADQSGLAAHLADDNFHVGIIIRSKLCQCMMIILRQFIKAFPAGIQ